MNKVKVVIAPGITLTVALAFLLTPPHHAFSGGWWFFILGIAAMGTVLNISLTRIQAWILRGPNTTVNNTIYTKESRS